MHGNRRNEEPGGYRSDSPCPDWIESRGVDYSAHANDLTSLAVIFAGFDYVDGCVNESGRLRRRPSSEQHQSSPDGGAIVKLAKRCLPMPRTGGVQRKGEANQRQRLREIDMSLEFGEIGPQVLDLVPPPECRERACPRNTTVNDERVAGWPVWLR
jgi:hypothetical protein